MIIKKYINFINENLKREIPLPNDIIKIAKSFHNSGKDLFVVGGAVRDFLQNKVPHDFDLVTNALPEETKHILKGWRVSDEQGANFGVLRIFTKDEPLGHEIATYRKDISKGRDTKGDEDKVEIGNHITIGDDVLRRDLTINALFYDINKKEIVDLVGGVEDIKNSIIRSVGDPKERFNEDRLRILRVFRFTARTDGEIDEMTSKAIKDDNRLRGIGPKEDVSQERIHEEWNKVIEHAQSDKSIMQRYIDLLTEYDMWEQMFPGMKINIDIKITYLNNAIIFTDLFIDNDIRELKRYMIRELKFSVELVNQIEFLNRLVKIDDSFSDVYQLSKLKYSYNIDDILINEYFLGNFADSFIKYCKDGIKTKGEDLISQGFKGSGIEREKERREIERFKTNYMR